jgi:hypothetical protein
VNTSALDRTCIKLQIFRIAGLCVALRLYFRAINVASEIKYERELSSPSVSGHAVA